MALDGPLEISDRTWWVGMRLPDDKFQCHAYFLDNGSDSVLIDPGSPLTIEATLAKVEQVSSLDSIRYLVCHHSDPDIAASLPVLSERLERPDIEVVTEWRAKALLAHYGHRFPYYLIEDHGWELPLAAGRTLEFQLTPYLHFPGAFVSYDASTATLFSSDLFGGFVPDSAILVSHDLHYIVESAQPFHQHYMPSSALLRAGLGRIRQRWPHIELIAPQHGHVIPREIVSGAFTALMSIDCGVFSLADADLDLQRLLRISEARTNLIDALLTVADPGSLVAALDTILIRTHEARSCALYVDVPEEGWTVWSRESQANRISAPPSGRPTVELPGTPLALLALTTESDAAPDDDLMRMLRELAHAIRPSVDQYLHDANEARLTADYQSAALTDPLTGLGNRRALEVDEPAGRYSLLSLDLDHFKDVNDTFGHNAGDVVLGHVSDAFRASVREDDHCYRLGGEEFLAYLPDTDGRAACVVAERIRNTVAVLELDGYAPDGHVTVSIGVASADGGPGDAFAAVLHRADVALYRAKDAGRNRTELAADPS